MALAIERLVDAHDAAFKAIITAGWANQSGGDVDSPCGAFALICISTAELPELADAVPEAAGVPTGYFTATEESSGIIWVWRWATEADAKADYERDAAAYATWLDEQGES